MKVFTIIFLLLSLSAMAEDKEGDLQLPVTDVSEMTRQEQQEIPSIDEVKMVQKPSAEKEASLQKKREGKYPPRLVK